mgnify:CR=1 FL=1
MPRHAHYVPHGVIPAVLLPFNDDLSIDEKAGTARVSARETTSAPSAERVTTPSRLSSRRAARAVPGSDVP